MSSASETQPSGEAARRPLFLIVRQAEDDDPTATFAKSIGDLAEVATATWTDPLDAAALARFIGQRLAGRDIVLYAQGPSTGVVLAARTGEVRRVMVVDPGESADVVPRPIDVVLTARDPKAPAFAAAAGVRIHRAAPWLQGYDEEVAGLIAETAREACRRASAGGLPSSAVLDEPLLEATPLIAGVLGYLGPEGEAFVEAYAARRPDAEAVALAGPARRPLDVLVLGAPVPTARLASFLTDLKPGGWLVARWSDPGVLPDLTALAQSGLQRPEPVDFGGTRVFRAQRSSQMRRAPPLLIVGNAMSPRLMDIRTRLPMQQLGSDPDIAVSYRTPLRNIPQAPLDQPKVVVTQRPGLTYMDEWPPVLARLIARGWVSIIEFDDHPQLVAELGGGSAGAPPLQRLAHAHGVETTVETLAQAFRPYNPEVAVFPNAVFEMRPLSEAPPPRRVFYGATPRGDLPAAVAESLGPAIERFPDMEFEVVGSQQVFDALPTARKTLHPYMSYEAYLDLMASCAVSLSPIEALPLRDTKSDAKFLDASRAAVLTIASPTIYARTIQHGENGLIAAELADWSRLLILAFADPGAARRMALQAWSEVRAERMFAYQIAARKAWYLNLWIRRDELNEALMARMPGLREEIAALGPR